MCLYSFLRPNVVSVTSNSFKFFLENQNKKNNVLDRGTILREPQTRFQQALLGLLAYLWSNGSRFNHNDKILNFLEHEFIHIFHCHSFITLDLSDHVTIVGSTAANRLVTQCYLCTEA